MIEKLIQYSERMPRLDVDASWLRTAFLCLGIAADARKYVSFCLACGFAAFVIAFIALQSIVGAVLAFLGIFAFLFFLPKIELDRMEGEMESELPFFLRDLGALINMGIPFLSAVSLLSQRKGTLNVEMGRVVSEMSKGASPVSALADMGARFGNTNIKRGMAQIISAYEQGGGGNELKRMGSDLLNSQRHKVREYAAKSSIYAILFIMVSVIGPTFYMIANIVGPVLYGSSASSNSLVPAMLVIFPAISYLILLLGRMSMPRTAFSQKGGLPLGIIAAVPLAAVLMLDIDMALKAVLLALVALLSALLFAKRHVEEKRTAAIEANLPNALLLISSLPRGTTFQKVVERLANSDLAGIKDEFRKANNQLRANLSPETAIRDMIERNRSPMLAKVMETMEHVYRAGGNVSERIAEMADDLLLFQEAGRERNSALAMQKYSVMLGMLVMPLVLSMAMGIAAKMGGIVGENTDFGFISECLVPAYLVLNAGIIAEFCASMDNDRSKELIYFSALAAAGVAVFFAASSIGILNVRNWAVFLMVAMDTETMGWTAGATMAFATLAIVVLAGCCGLIPEGCSSPYINDSGGGCCLDSDSNGICDPETRTCPDGSTVAYGSACPNGEFGNGTYDCSKYSQQPCGHYRDAYCDKFTYNDIAVREAVSSAISRHPGWYSVNQLIDIYDWTKKSIFYSNVPLDASAPYYPNETLRVKSGDCKNQAVLVASMVKALGGDANVRIVPGCSHAFPYVRIGNESNLNATMDAIWAHYANARNKSLYYYYVKEGNDTVYWVPFDTAGANYPGDILDACTNTTQAFQVYGCNDTGESRDLETGAIEYGPDTKINATDVINGAQTHAYWINKSSYYNWCKYEIGVESLSGPMDWYVLDGKGYDDYINRRSFSYYHWEANVQDGQFSMNWVRNDTVYVVIRNNAKDRITAKTVFVTTCYRN